MALEPDALPEAVLAFTRERHLATLTTLRADGSPHAVPVGYTFDPAARQVRVITGGDSQKARNAAHGARAALCSVDGGRWVSFEGPTRVRDDQQAVADAVAAYAAKYRTPRENPRRVVLIIDIDRVLGRG